MGKYFLPFLCLALAGCVVGEKKREGQLYKYESGNTQLFGVPAISRLAAAVNVPVKVLMADALTPIPTGLRLRVTTPRKERLEFPVSRNGKAELSGLTEKGEYLVELKHGALAASESFDLQDLDPAPLTLTLR